MAHISVVVPVYGCKTTLVELYIRLKESLTPISEDFEIILVNDKSPDFAWDTIVEIAKKDSRVKGINLSRNFGQHAAITAGLDHCNAEWIVVMDCDLQDQPEEIAKLYEKTFDGFDVVLARRFERQDSILKRITSYLFYKTLTYLTDTEYDESVANFGIYNKKVIDSFCEMRENIRVFPIMIQWLGYERAKININHSARSEGKSSYTFFKRMRLALDIILAYSDKPIRLIIKFGFLVTLASFIFGGITLAKYFSGAITVSGYTSLILSIWFLSGITITILGIIGLYVGKIFEGVKSRPLYAIKNKVNESK